MLPLSGYSLGYAHYHPGITLILAGLSLAISFPDHTQLLNTTDYSCLLFCFRQCSGTQVALLTCSQIQATLKICFLRSVFEIYSDPQKISSYLSLCTSFCKLAHLQFIQPLSPMNVTLFQWPITTATVFEGALRFELIYTLLLMKSVSLQRDLDIWCVIASSPSDSLNQALGRRAGTMDTSLKVTSQFRS